MYRGRQELERENSESNNQRDPDRRQVAEVTTNQGDHTTPSNTDNNDANDNNGQDNDTSASSRFGSRGNKRQKRNVGSITTGPRRIGRATTVGKPNDYDIRARAEMDSRADTVCGGSTFELYQDTGKVVDVGGFHPSMDLMKSIKVGTLITAIDLADETIIGVFNQGLYFGNSMEQSLIPPAQLWDHGVTCDITPKWASRGKSIHGIYSSDDDVYVPFQLHGHMPYFSTRLPTSQEKDKCRWVTFTSDREWEPYSDHFRQSEQATAAYYAEPHLGMNRPTYDNQGNTVQINAVTTTDTRYVSAISTIQETMDESFDIEPPFGERYAAATSSKERRTNVPHTTLARRWGTSMDTVNNTMRTTTQRGLRYLQGDLTRRFRTRQTHLQNRLLNTRMYTDTMFSEQPLQLGKPAHNSSSQPKASPMA